MVKINGLPVYAATLAQAGDGVLRVSLVDRPAVESNFDYFRAAADAPALYAVQDEERRLVRGVVLRADFPILRRDTPDDPGYYVTFSAEVIRQAAERWLADGHANDVNLQHEDGSDVDGVQMVQFFIKDPDAGVDPEGFDSIAAGSLFAEYHVTNDDVWDEIKAGTFKGFSVEIFYTLVPVDETGAASSFAAAVDSIINTISQNMSFDKFKARLAAILTEPAPDPAKMGSVTTDKGVLTWDGGDDLKAGDRVQMQDADGNVEDAAAGDYTTGDGKVIVVVDGTVSEIKDPDAEVAPEDKAAPTEDLKAQAFSRAARFTESYDEKSRKIFGAIRAARGNRDDDYGYLVDAGDDFGVFAYYGEDTGWEDRYVRYFIAWDADGNATASDPVDCRQAFVPLDFDDSAAFAGSTAQDDTAAEAQMEAALTAAEHFKAEVDTLKARIAELEKVPAAPSAHDKFNARTADGQSPAGRLRSYLNKL